MNYCIYIRKRKGKPYCKLNNKEINLCECNGCANKEYKTKIIKKNKSVKYNNPQKSGKMKTKRSKATDIEQSVKQIVWERDKHCCVICGNNVNVMPNAHYISRAKGGLGIEENIFTACTRLTENDCHYKFDNGTKEEKEELKKIVKNHFKSIYKNWSEEKLYYKK